MARHVRKGDSVMVTSGDYKGQVGEVLRIDTKHDRVIVKGINVVTRHMKATQKNPQGGIITKEAGIHISKVSPVVDGKPSRVRFATKADGTKVRVAAKGGKELSTLRKGK